MTNCENSSTFLPQRLNFSRSFMSRRVLPLDLMKSSSSVAWDQDLISVYVSGEIRQGWLQHFLSWVATELKLAAVRLLIMEVLFFQMMPRQYRFCREVIQTSMIVSDSLGMVLQTSSFTLRSRQGFSIFLKSLTCYQVLRFPYLAMNSYSLAKSLG